MRWVLVGEGAGADCLAIAGFVGVVGSVAFLLVSAVTGELSAMDVYGKLHIGMRVPAFNKGLRLDENVPSPSWDCVAEVLAVAGA